MMPDGSGWTAEEDWRDDVWRRYDEVLFPDFRVLSELDKALLMRGSVVVSLTVVPRGTGELTERG